MSWHTIGTIYGKELRDSVRDRRTLLSTIIIPTIVMPALVLGLGKVASAVISKAKEEIPRRASKRRSNPVRRRRSPCTTTRGS
jgi:sodium transport system permease protein